MTKLRWSNPPREADPAQVRRSPGEKPMLRDGVEQFGTQTTLEARRDDLKSRLAGLNLKSRRLTGDIEAVEAKLGIIKGRTTRTALRKARKEIEVTLAALEEERRDLHVQLMWLERAG